MRGVKVGTLLESSIFSQIALVVHDEFIITSSNDRTRNPKRIGQELGQSRQRGFLGTTDGISHGIGTGSGGCARGGWMDQIQ
jgi:hypothetical protein